MGTIEKIDGDKIHLRAADGSAVVVTVKDGTPVQIARQGTIADLRKGGQIVVQGQKDADGNLTATSVSQGGGRR
ncbi:hypothetical protein OIE66_23125 [Nonomuraea sp. NBC_01738]|uniref:hypothetical protein n=1 Tax=Nonomuraea sp. NBC_01738 TaxID=2976003 RepID=UPI002E115089|nr:hypothetical protein OIE66_23125 [Nonomuraea sp. NBC_01738]